MPETLVENEFCEACGTDVRPAALFCYHCGGPVTEQAVRMVSERSLSKSVVDSKTKTEPLSEEVSEEFETEKEFEKNNSKPAGVLEKDEDTTEKEKKLTSASSIRNKARPLPPKKIEIIWEEHENAPNAWFISVALILSVLVLVILFLAMYLR